MARAAFAGALQLDRESTKSESPELRASVHEVPPTNPINASGEQPNTSAKSPESSTIICASNSASQPLSGSQNVDQHAKNHGLSVRKTSENVADVNRAPKHRPLKGDLATAQNAQIHSNPLHKSDPIFDPIESDTESFHEKQQMQSAKRLRSSKTPTATFNSLGTSNQEGISRRDGPFVVPAVPQPRTDESRKSLSERTSLGQRKNTPMLRQKPKDVNVSGPNDLKRHGKTLEDAQSEGCNNDRFDVAQETPKRNTVCNDLVDANQTTSRVTTAGLQGSNNTTHGTTEPTVQQRDDSISGQSQEPDNITHLGHNANVVATNPDDSRFAQEAERLAKGAKEQQTKNRVRQKKVEEKEPASEAMERSAANREAVERRTKENVLAGSKGAKEDKAKAKEPMQAKKTNAKEGLVEGKRMQEIRLKEAARERQIKEVSLAEEAHKAMLAADGAKQIEAEEKKKKEKARHEELAAKKQANEAKAVEQARAVQKRDHEKKLREEQRAREKAQKLADAECEDAKGQMPPARTDRETATAVMEQARKRIADREAQRLKGSSEAQSRDSTHPLTSSLVADLRRSMTPRIPGYAVANSSPHLNSLRSSPLSNQSPGNMGAPLRSALRKTPSALRRSVSSVSFHVPPGAKLNEGIASMPNPKSLKENDNQFATKPSAVKDIPTSSPGIASKTPIKTPIPKKISHGKITKTPAKNGKVQTKLNVTRQPKKLKGLAIAPPIKSTQAPKQEIVISSGEDSSTSEEPVWQTGNAEAGPSSRKPTLPAVSRSMKTGQVKSSGARMDPSLRNVKAEKDRTAAPAALPRSKSTSDTTFLPNTTSRSPALPASETISLSSGSASSTASSIASESESESDSKPEPQAPSSKTRTGTESGTRAPVTRAPVPVKGVSKAVNQVAKRPAGHLKSIASSQSSSLVSSSRSRSISIDSTKCDGEHIDQAANKQLQLESRSSVPNARANQTPPTANDAVGDTVINQGLDHDGRLPNGIRPTYYKYPCLSELKKLSRAATPEVEPNLNTSSSQLVGASLGSTENSSSDSDESSSNNSDDHENFDGPLSQVKPKKPFPGMKGLMRRRLSEFCYVLYSC